MSVPNINFPITKPQRETRTQLSPRVSHRKCQARKTPLCTQLAIQNLKSIPSKGVKYPSVIQHFGVFGGLRCKESSCDVYIRIRFPQKVCLVTVSTNASQCLSAPHTRFRIFCWWPLPRPRVGASCDREYLGVLPLRLHSQPLTKFSLVSLSTVETN